MSYKGKYTPENPEKYIGDPTNIIYRSLWERKIMVYFDSSSNVLQWGSEEIKIPYISPIDEKRHIYFVDFYVKFKHKSGEIKEALIEVKPYKQTKPPKEPKRRTRKFYQEMKTFSVNIAKWNQAKLLCESKGWNFLIWTEKNVPFIK